MRSVMVALLMSIVESAVNFVEMKYGGAAGTSKRAAAWKYVKDKIGFIESLLGKLGVDFDDSTVLGLIDATVLAKNNAGEFEKSKGAPPHYNITKPRAAFEWIDPKTGIRQWARIGESGEIEPVEVVRDRATGKLVPAPEEEEEEDEPILVAPDGEPPQQQPARHGTKKRKK